MTMTWTTEQWDAFCVLLDAAWPGDFEATHAKAYRVLLAEFEPEAASTALKALINAGQRFRPSVAELVHTIRGIDDGPAVPTWLEVHRALFGGGIPPRLSEGGGVTAAHDIHPYLGAFVAAQGWRRLMEMPIHDDEFGPLRLRDLADQWQHHVAEMERRTARGLALGAPTRAAALRKFDPLAGLGVPRPAEIEAGAGQ